MVNIDEAGVLVKYIDIVKNIYDGVVVNIRTCGDLTCNFLITVRLLQGSPLCSFLFAIVIDKLINAIQDNILCCMLFIYDIILVNEKRAGVNVKLELWRQTL